MPAAPLTSLEARESHKGKARDFRLSGFRKEQVLTRGVGSKQLYACPLCLTTRRCSELKFTCCSYLPQLFGLSLSLHTSCDPKLRPKILQGGTYQLNLTQHGAGASPSRWPRVPPAVTKHHRVTTIAPCPATLFFFDVSGFVAFLKNYLIFI